MPGAFGSFINIENAIAIGLLPDLPRDRFQFVGNGSLQGATLLALSRDLLAEERRVAAMMTNFELSETPGLHEPLHRRPVSAPHADGTFPDG